MKKQINPNIKAHLIRSSFYVLLLLAVCVIPFALAQRNTPKQGNAARTKVAATVDKAKLAAARRPAHRLRWSALAPCQSPRQAIGSRRLRKRQAVPRGLTC